MADPAAPAREGREEIEVLFVPPFIAVLDNYLAGQTVSINDPTPKNTARKYIVEDGGDGLVLGGAEPATSPEIAVRTFSPECPEGDG